MSCLLYRKSFWSWRTVCQNSCLCKAVKQDTTAIKIWKIIKHMFAELVNLMILFSKSVIKHCNISKPYFSYEWNYMIIQFEKCQGNFPPTPPNIWLFKKPHLHQKRDTCGLAKISLLLLYSTSDTFMSLSFLLCSSYQGNVCCGAKVNKSQLHDLWKIPYYKRKLWNYRGRWKVMQIKFWIS